MIHVHGVILFLICIILQLCTCKGSYLHHFCQNQSTSDFLSDSTDQLNLNLLLSTLSVNPTGGFKNATVIGGRNGEGDFFYGVSLCRGDISSDLCRSCVASSTVAIQERCAGRKSAVIWYDECMLRYSNVSFFSAMVMSPHIIFTNTENVSDPARFSPLLYNTLSGLERLVVDNNFPVVNFATLEASFSRNQTLYSLAQCAPDLSGFDCSRCLQKAISGASRCCKFSQGVTVLMPSCNLRYELYPFYEERLQLTSATGSSTTARDRLLIGLTVGTVVVLLSLLSLYCCYSWRRQRKCKAEKDTQGGMPLFKFDTIVAATRNFSQENKVGEGGFGAMYKGILSNGKRVFVKRMCVKYGGEKEAEGEVMLVGKLQKRGLLRLIGYCIEGGEILFIYDIVPVKRAGCFMFSTWFSTDIPQGITQA